MDQESIAKMRRVLALAMAAGKVNDTMRQLKGMPLETLEALSNAEFENVIDCSGLDAGQVKSLEAGIKKLDFYVCGILMHRILDEK